MGKSFRLPNPALTQYNGVELTENTVTDRISIRPKKDSSNRVTIYNEYQFHFTTYFGDNQTDAQIQSIRERLTEPGKPFQFNGRGFGVFSINQSRYGAQDVVWGPETQEVSFDLFGPGVTRRMEWTFVARVSDCKGARFVGSGRVIEYNTEITHQPTKEGLTRTITGHLVIPNNRGGLGNRQALDSADQWRDRVLPPMLPGFDREYDNFTLSEDRSRLDWTVRDIEFGLNVPPKFVIRPPKVRHSVSPAPGAKGLAAWVGTLSAEYKLAKTAPDKYWPVKHFFGVVVADRVGAASDTMLNDPDFDAKAAAIVPVRIGIEEPDIYGEVPTYNLSFSWVFATRFQKLLSRSPMWRPVPNAGGWVEWVESLSGTVLDPYGTAQVRFRAADDRMTDLCDGGSLRSQALARLPIDRELRTFQDVAMEALAESINLPTPQNSYLYWESRLFIEVDGGLVPVKPLPTKPPKLTSPQLQGGSLAKLIGSAINAGAASARAMASQMRAVPGAGGGGGRLVNEPKEKSDPQQRVHDKCYIWLIGKGARAGYPIGCPTTTEINGARLVALPRTDRREGFTTWEGFNAGLFPVYHATWALRFYAPDGIPPGPLLPFDNPLMDENL